MGEEEESILMVDSSLLNRSAEDPEVPDSYKDMVHVAFGIERYYLKVICALGFPGNLAAMLTIALVRPVSTATALVALLAASDSAALLLKLITNELWHHPQYVNDHYCRSLALVNVCSSFANWVLVMIAFERLVAVMLPVTRHRFLSKRRLCCVCVLIASLIFSIHAPMMAGREERRDQDKCVIKAGMWDYGLDVWPWLTITVYALLPLSLLLVITIALFVSLRRARYRRQHLMEGSVGAGGATFHRELRRSERAVTSMTMAASLLFILLILPQCLYSILFQYTAVFRYLHDTAIALLLKQIAYLLADSTHALNFYLYFLSVRRFRVYFWKMLRCKRTVCAPKFQSSPTTATSKKEGVTTRTLIEDVEDQLVLNGTAARAESPALDRSSWTKK